MAHSLELNTNQKERNFLFTISLILMSILLHQSNVLFGVNISFADVFCFLLLVFFFTKKSLVIPIAPVLFFLMISIVVLISAMFIVPFQFGVFPEPVGIISDFIKLIAILLYFLVGYNLALSNHIEKGVKWFSFFGLLIGTIGVLFTFFNVKVLSSTLYYSEIRFRGFMNDPNYYSILQITALVYFSRIKDIKVRYRVLAILITALAVILSGSKTGVITLLCYAGLRLTEYVFISGKKYRAVIIQMTVIFVLCLIGAFVFTWLQDILISVANNIPAFARVQYLFTDFGTAISENGSSRGATWQVALQIIQHSPFWGIGIGTYTEVAMEWFATRSIAHNTYLQLSAEWGMPLAIIFFSYVFYLLVKTKTINFRNKMLNLIYRDILVILFIGSMAISLNNARVLWLILGALVATTMSMKIGVLKRKIF